MSSKFSKRGGVQPTPKICKAVGDSFRFVSTPFHKELTAVVNQTMELISFGFDFNATGVLVQQGNPLQVWAGTLGDPLALHVDLRLDYDNIVNVATLHYIAFNAHIAVLARVKIIANIDLKVPFNSGLMRMLPDPVQGKIWAQIMY